MVACVGEKAVSCYKHFSVQVSYIVTVAFRFHCSLHHRIIMGRMDFFLFCVDKMKIVFKAIFSPDFKSCPIKLTPKATVILDNRRLIYYFSNAFAI